MYLAYIAPIIFLVIQITVFDIRFVVMKWRQRNSGQVTRNTLLSLYILFCKYQVNLDLFIIVYVSMMFIFPF